MYNIFHIPRSTNETHLFNYVTHSPLLPPLTRRFDMTHQTPLRMACFHSPKIGVPDSD